MTLVDKRAVEASTLRKMALVLMQKPLPKTKEEFEAIANEFLREADELDMKADSK